MFERSRNVQDPRSHQRSNSTPHRPNPPSILSAPSSAPAEILNEPVAPEAIGLPGAHLTDLEPFLAAPFPAQYRQDQQTRIEAAIFNRQLPPLVTDQANERISHGLLATPSSLFSTAKDIDFQNSPPQSPQLSPTKERWSFLSSVAGNKGIENKFESKNVKLSDWFQGQSAPVRLGILPSPAQEEANPMETPSIPADLIRRSQRSSTLSPARPSPLSSGRFSFFGSKTSLPSASPAPEGDDEYIKLDIRNALLPNLSTDPFSPSSFKNLLQNAEGLLTRLQTAYKQRVVTLKEVKAEKELQADELEEAKTRARHLKLQLDDMSTKAAAQDNAMMNLVDELAAQKQWRQEQERRMSTVRLVNGNKEAQWHHSPRRRVRTSEATTVSDSGFESNDDSPTESIFSEAEENSSAALSVISTPSMDTPETFPEPHRLFHTASNRYNTVQPYPPHTINNFTHASVPTISHPGSRTPCTNCGGLKTSEVYDVMCILKEENSGLKQRVQHLEGELDGCLEMVSGLGLS